MKAESSQRKKFCLGFLSFQFIFLKIALEDRPATVNDTERGWLKQLKDICKKFTSFSSDETHSSSFWRDSTLFNGMVFSPSFSIAMVFERMLTPYAVKV